MNYQEESKEELIFRLQESEKTNAGLKVLYENSINKLNEEKELFEKTFSTSSDAILLTRLQDGYFVYINSAFTKLTGYTVGDISDKTTLDINLWQDPTQRNIFTKELNTTGIFDNFEIIFRRKDQSLFTALLSAKYVIFQGTPHILSILHDLTETKHTQELLKESEEKYKLLVDNAIEAIVVICESSLTFCNPEASDLTGYSIEELLAMPFSDLIYTEDRDFVSERYKQRITGNDVESRYQFRLLKKDNSIIWVEINSTMFRWEGKPATLNFVYNINERKLAEAALQESEALYRSFINASPDDVTITDLEGRIRMISPKGVAMFGYQDKDELIGHFIFEYLIPEDHPKAQKNIELMFQGTFTGLGEYKAIHANGSILDIEVNAEFIPNPTGQPAGLVFIVRDITKRKLTEEAIIKLNESLKISNDIIKANLEQKNALIEELTQTKLKLEKINSEKDKFFSIIAHDLRSPFQGFLGMTKVLTQDLSSFTLAELSHIYKELDKSANNLYKLLENLLEWAEMQKESTSFTPGESSLFSAVLQCIHTIYHRAEQKRIKIINAVPEALTVYADERMLNTVIRNILSNAVKFTHTNGEIKIFAKEIEDNMIEISLADTGIGIDADNLNKIFRIDQKLRNTGTEGEAGTGLGLLLCKEFVEKNGGKIWVESKIDVGSTFFFTLKKA